MKLLNEASAITGIDRNNQYGNPMDNFEATAALKRAFWHHVGLTIKRRGVNRDKLANEELVDLRDQNTPFGHCVDMIFTNLGRIATSPSFNLQKDRPLDLAAYSAILYEIATILKRVG